MTRRAPRGKCRAAVDFSQSHLTGRRDNRIRAAPQPLNNYLTVAYVRGVVPRGKEPETGDAKLIEKYAVDQSKWGRSVDARNGVARMQYMRHERTFLLMATHGAHRFFEDEKGSVRDARKSSIKYAGYSISYRRGQDSKYHPHVRIKREQLAMLKEHFWQLALRPSTERIARELADLPFEPYAPIRRQLFELLRAINRVRIRQAYPQIPTSVLRLRRRVVKPLG